MTPEVPPPHRVISSTPILLPNASTLLAKFVHNSEKHAHLHPDALITPTGINFSTNGGRMGGAVVHNLRRVLVGMQGEYLEPEKTPEPENKEEEEEEEGRKRNGKAKRPRKMKDEGWQSMSEYEREVEVEIGELGQRSNFVGEGGDAPEVRIVGEKRKTGIGEESRVDKEAKKKAKKERNKEFKRQKEKERAGQA